MTINIYRWDDASAPQLTGQVGSLTTLLDALLVNGYGSKSAAGWAIAFTGTNLRAYRAASGNRMYLAVDDTNPAPGSYGALAARLLSYETMSAVQVGTKSNPTQALMTQVSINGSQGAVALKSTTNDSTTRPWIAYISETFIHLNVFISINAATGTIYNILGSTNIGGFAFGDLVNQQKAGDAYGTILMAGSTTSSSSSNQMANVAGSSATIMSGHWMQRAYHQYGVGIGCLKGAVNRGCGTSTLIGADTSGAPFPDPITGGFEMSEVWAFEVVFVGQASARGRIPGLYNPLHSPTSLTTSAFQIGDTILGAGVYAGQTYQFTTYGNGGIGLIQTSGTW